MSLLDKRFYFHVGAQHSGAWLLQKYLDRHSQFFLEGGVHYLTRAQVGPVVGWGGKFAAAPEGLIELVSRALQRRQTYAVVASNENTLGQPFEGDGGGLYAGSVAAIDALGTVAQSYPCTALLSVRPQADFVPACYLHAVNEGEPRPFDEWLSELDLPDLSWRQVHERLVAALGRDNVRVLDYRRAEQNRAALVSDFLSAIDVDVPVELPNQKLESPVWSRKQLTILLAANRCSISGEQRAALREFVRTQYRDTRNGSETLLTPDQRAQLDGLYMAEYEELVTNSAQDAK